VVVRRAGDVIPEVARYLPDKRPANARAIVMPEKCPVCQSPVVREEDQAVYKCTGGVLKCRAQRAEWLMHFAGRRAMDIEGLGEKLIEQLVSDGTVSSPADLYDIDAKSLAERERMGEKSAQNVVDAIARSRTTTLPRLLFALGIPQVGESTALALALQFGSVEKLEAASAAEIEETPDVGPIVSRSVFEFFQSDLARSVVERLKARGVTYEPIKVEERASLPLAGLTFVITGTLAGLQRDAAEDALRGLGAKVSGSVSKKTSFLVVGADAGSKLAKAQSLGVRILDEAALEQILKTKQPPGPG
jgi:DNA ligase (NAD+)